MNVPPDSGTPSLNFVKLAAWITLLALFISWQVQWSLVNGRLSQPVGYDDVMYLSDALTRLRILQWDGMYAFLSDLWSNPPHSPLATAIALLGYVIMGTSTWAPYVAAGLMLVPLALIVESWVKDLPWWSGPILGIGLLCLPFSGFVISEFRPDLWSAILFAWGIQTASTCKPSSHGTLLRTGAILAVAVMAKPSTLPVSLLILAAFSFALALRWKLAGETATWIRGSMPAAIPATFALTLSAPYLYANHTHLINYIWENTFGANRGIWDSHLGVGGRLNYYVSGEGARIMVVQPWTILLLLGVSAGVFMRCLVRKQKTSRALLIAVAALLPWMAAFLPLVTAPLQTPFIGALIPLGVVLGACLLSIKVMTSYYQRLVTVLLVTLILIGSSLIGFRVRSPSDLTLDPILRTQHRHVLDQVIEATGNGTTEPVSMETSGIGGKLGTSLTALGMHVFPVYVLGNTSAFALESVVYESLTKGLPPSAGVPAVRSLTFNREIEDHRHAIMDSSWFLEIEPTDPGWNARFPQSHLATDIRAIRNEMGFIFIKRLTEGERLFGSLWVNPRRLALSFTEGWGAWEGPYPDQHLPRLRWAIGTTAKICIPPIASTNKIPLMLKLKLRPIRPMDVTLASGDNTGAVIHVEQESWITTPVTLCQDEQIVTVRFSDINIPSPQDAEQRPLAAMLLEYEFGRAGN